MVCVLKYCVKGTGKVFKNKFQKGANFINKKKIFIAMYGFVGKQKRTKTADAFDARSSEIKS